eukprot:7730088-Alexandrium_andersonii.AAC.1
MPPAHRAPIDRPFGVGGVCHGPVAHDGRPGDSSLAGARPCSDGGICPQGKHDHVRPVGVLHARSASRGS